MHHNFDDSDSGYDVESDNKGKPFGIGGYKGRIIFLGDGTEVLTDSDDTEMFDNVEEDKDLASQVSKDSASDEKKPPAEGTSTADEAKEGSDAGKKEGEASEKILKTALPEKLPTTSETKTESRAGEQIPDASEK